VIAQLGTPSSMRAWRPLTELIISEQGAERVGGDASVCNHDHGAGRMRDGEIVEGCREAGRSHGRGVSTPRFESTFATVRLRQRVTKGPGSRAAGIAMAFKLIESAQQHRWRTVNSAHLVALVRAGASVRWRGG
jgi:hypothetical protein